MNQKSYFFQHLRDSRGAQHSLSVSADSPDVSLGQESLHPPAPEATGDEETHQDSQQRVRGYMMCAVCAL